MEKEDIKKIIADSFHEVFKELTKDMNLDKLNEIATANQRLRKENKRIVKRLLELNDRYNDVIRDSNTERFHLNITKLQLESRIKELEAEVRELRKDEVK